MEKVKVKKVETCSDCVHAKACQMWNNRSISNKTASCCVNFEQRDVKSTKRASVEHGYWCGCVCSVCGDAHGPYNSHHLQFYSFCPNCGARMNGEMK